jgi:hypothetical protein
MVRADGVEVWLERYSDGFRYQEHTAPFGTMKYTDNANEKYVEVGSNERFRIVVELLEGSEGFCFMGCPDVVVECRVDMGPGDRGVLPKIKPRYWCSSESQRHAYFSEVDRVVAGQHQECGLTFVKLESGMIPWSITTRSYRLTIYRDDDLMLTQDEIANAADQIGLITITLQLGTLFLLGTPNDRIPSRHVEPKASHPKVISLHHVSHTLRYVY